MWEREVRRRPEETAVVSEGRRMSYREVNEAANQLGHYLKKLGVGPEVRVGLLLERSVELVIGILGVYKAGGAYVALEPGYPRERLGYLLEDAQAGVIVTEGKLEERLPGHWGQVVRLDEERERIGEESVEDPEGEGEGENLAYVIYTSGSTGRPKGVGVEQRQLMNYIRGVGERLGEGEGKKWGLVSTVAADLGHTALYGSLCGGGELHVIPEERGRDREWVGRYMEARRDECDGDNADATAGADGEGARSGARERERERERERGKGGEQRRGGGEREERRESRGKSRGKG